MQGYSKAANTKSLPGILLLLFKEKLLFLTFSVLVATRKKLLHTPVAPVAQRYHVTSDTLGREFDPGKRDLPH